MEEWNDGRMIGAGKQALIGVVEEILQHMEENRSVQILESHTEYF